MPSQCAWQSSCSSVRGGRGGGLFGRDPCGGAMRRTEAALSPGVTGGRAVALDMLILLNAGYNCTKKDVPYMCVCVSIYQ